MEVIKDRNTKPRYRELIISKILVLFGLYATIVVMLWLLDSSFKRDNILYYIIVLSFTFKVVSYIAEWLLIWHPSAPEKPNTHREYTVDVLTTYVKGEPKDMIKNSLLAIKSITYPHETFLCDEADDPELNEFCIQNNIHHVTRGKKINAKAGNINNALQTVAKSEIVLILDPDHVVYPNFLDEVLPFFEDEQIGFVQVVQAYSNQNETIMAKAAAEQTYQFYGPAMMTLNSFGAVPAIGANCTFRRAALDSIGGHAPGLTEDMHTTLKLKAKGWKSVYNPVIVAKGLVPWNFSGYCLQQLKWSRGSFDLLFNVFPKVFKNLSWSQRFAFLAVPLFYLSGIIALIDFLIPVIALLFSIIPINLGVFEFLIYYSQLYLISQVIRFYHQKWYYEKHEKGTAVLGGILLKTSWWCTTLGFLYSLINKKVPYIPTPKDFKHETPWKLLIPGFLLMSLSLFAIIYGLSHDFTPFSIFMAILAFLNFSILSFGSLMAMQKQIVFVHNLFRGSFITKNSSTRRFIFEVKHKVFKILQKNLIVVFSLLLVLFTNVAIIKITPSMVQHVLSYGKIGLKISEIFDASPSIYGKKYGQFYVGVHNKKKLQYSKTNASFVKADFYLNQQNEVSLYQFLDSCYSNNILPFLSLSVDTAYYWSIMENDSVLTLKNIYNEIRKRYMPVIIMFDRNLHNVPDDYYATFQKHAYHLSDSLAINTNITWVWHSKDLNNDLQVRDSSRSDMIDWIYADDETVFASRHSYYARGSSDLLKPLLVSSTNIRNVHKWKIDKNTYIKNVVGILGAQPKASDKLTYNLEDIFKKPEKQKVNRLRLSEYVKGIAYNPGKGGGNNSDLPLTIDKLKRDFSLINEMGCNTIRRFDPSIYDFNLLKTAKEFDLNVLYGFWFENTIDYHKDSRRLSKYKKEVLKKVRKYQSGTSIVSWGFGNETWYWLNERFGQPYLSIVRTSYLKYMNDLLKEVKQIDNSRPTYVVENQITSSMYAFTEYVPFLDFFGINSYYGNGIDDLKEMTQRNLNGMPYLVSEYGHRAPWDIANNDFDKDNNILEPSSTQKAKEYATCWNDYILPDKDNNLGGIAFCWQDRYESTATWFGILDIFGNKKPAYYAIKSAYSDNSQNYSFPQFPVPEYEIKAEQDKANKYKFDVKALPGKNGENDKFQFKWILYNKKSVFGNDNIFDKIVETDFEYNKTSYSFTLPNDYGNYRIYLYVKDDFGNVITKNLPIADFTNTKN